MLQPGDTLMGMDLANGGHLSARRAASISPANTITASATASIPETGRIDYDHVEDLVKQHHPKLLIAGASAYPRAIDFKTMGEIAHRNGALFMVDMAHIAGLVAGGQHMNPVPYADVVTTTTHKTLRGPRGGMILAREEFGKAINKAVFPGTQGGPLMHVIAAKAVCLREAMQPEFQHLRGEHRQERLRAGGCAASLRLPPRLRRHGQPSDAARPARRGPHRQGASRPPRRASISPLNKNAVPNDPQKPSLTSGVRIGTPAATTRGFTPEDMPVVADCIDKIATDFESNRKAVLAAVAELVRKHPIYE